MNNKKVKDLTLLTLMIIRMYPQLTLKGYG